MDGPKNIELLSNLSLFNLIIPSIIRSLKIAYVDHLHRPLKKGESVLEIPAGNPITTKQCQRASPAKGDESRILAAAVEMKLPERENSINFHPQCTVLQRPTEMHSLCAAGK